MHPRGGRLEAIKPDYIQIEFQSTHPRGVRHYAHRARVRVRGFNPRTHGGCDHLLRPLPLPTFCFNPRTHGGCDLRMVVIYQIILQVSIHAPTGGATGRARRAGGSSAGFNPRTHGGCDSRRLSPTASEPMFQSTHPRGVRPKAAGPVPASFGFNPRTHGGCDSHAWVLPLHCFSFNPRTHGGCDFLFINEANHLPFVSIHAPTGGATALLLRRICRKDSFNPRTHGGCDAARPGTTNPARVSIHAPTGGATCHSV